MHGAEENVRIKFRILFRHDDLKVLFLSIKGNSRVRFCAFLCTIDTISVA